jgi:hypothetical protein
LRQTMPSEVDRMSSAGNERHSPGHAKGCIKADEALR